MRVFTLFLVVIAQALNVRLRQGMLMGKRMTLTANNQTFTGDAYLGIPYARPPVGNLRWADPQPAPVWSGVFNATQFSPGCMQNLSSPYAIGNCPANVSEDCLYLNIFTPTNATSLAAAYRRLPVMVWIHGGGYINGAGGCEFYNGLALVNRNNQIIVTINYRLSSLGFLVTPKISGNFGIKDQQLALQWVRDNIDNFGGDCGSITIFGESAGANSVGVHLTSPLSAGLFHKAIMQSNPVNQEYSNYSTAIQMGNTFAAAVGCNASDLNCFRSLNTHTIQANSPDDLTSWGLVTGSPLLPDAPMNLFKRGRYNKVPVIMGTNGNEMALFLALAPANNLTASAYEALLQSLYPGFYQQVLELYPAQQNADNNLVYALIQTHQTFSCPSLQVVQAVAQYNPPNQGVYLYYLEHPPAFGGIIYGPYCGEAVCHSVDLFFIFDTIEELSQGYFKLTPDEVVLAHAMENYWGALAANGIPNPSAQPGITFEPQWPRFTRSSNISLILDTPRPYTASNYLTRYCNFWEAHAST